MAGLLVTLVACTGGGRAAVPTTVPCLAVSVYVHATLAPQPDSPLAAVEGPGLWYVSSAAGATWAVDFDPTSDGDHEGHILALNDKARAGAQFGSPALVGERAAQTIRANDPGAVRSRECAARARRQ
jgi:hypothetical protein